MEAAGARSAVARDRSPQLRLNLREPSALLRALRTCVVVRLPAILDGADRRWPPLQPATGLRRALFVHVGHPPSDAVSPQVRESRALGHLWTTFGRGPVPRDTASRPQL